MQAPVGKPENPQLNLPVLDERERECELTTTKEPLRAVNRVERPETTSGSTLVIPRVDCVQNMQSSVAVGSAMFTAVTTSTRIAASSRSFAASSSPTISETPVSLDMRATIACTAKSATVTGLRSSLVTVRIRLRSEDK